ncbi:hypothetical protein CFAM422_001643 [Trichoderma lentiforme]|uniref:F-box domain-containing protein n=1 Tax=Trichoderma lentiforme TaxID=1567552 RepID=A0A9P4XQV2_9HYPO|nr:hypothetical protein CFAM422_001643 [Trichoderma lentiforme]
MYQNTRTYSRKRRSQRLIEAEKSKKRLRDSTEPIHLPILSFPTEILLSVISHLPSPWQLSLGLTCRFFSELTRRNTLPRLEGKDLVEFLSTLQRDIPNMYFCYCCNKLRTLDPNLDYKNQAHTETVGAFKNSRWVPHPTNTLHIELPPYYSSFFFATKISFMEANLVMSRHFKGFSLGTSLRNFERCSILEDVIELGKCLRFRRRLKRRNYISEDFVHPETKFPEENLEALPRRENAWRFLFRSSPKIIDDELFIARFYTLTGPPVSLEQLKKLMESTSIPICSHLTCSAFLYCCYLMRSLPKRYLRCCPFIRPESPYRDDDGKRIKFDSERDSCLLCSTDYDISVDLETNNGTTIKISIYHRLGSCRSPSDKLWNYFVNPHSEVSRRNLIRDADLNDPYHFDSNGLFNFENIPSAQEIRSRHLEVDPGVARRKWHEEAPDEKL